MSTEKLIALEIKVCGKCKEGKPFSEYHKNKAMRDGYASQCKKCFSITGKNSYIKNREKRLLYNQQYSKENRDKKAEYLKVYRENNRERVRFWEKAAYKEKVTTDCLYKLKRSLRGRVRAFLKCSGIKRVCTTRELVGADYDIVKKYLEEKFQEGMCWENHGKWHIEHIKPITTAKTEEEKKKLCHYTNLQPLWATDNIKKGNRVL